MADPRRATFLLFAALALSAALPRGAAGQTLTSSAPARPQTINVTVTDKWGNPVKGLRAEDFGVFEGDRRLPLVSFSNEDAPTTVGILLDASGSMTSQFERKVWAALAEFPAAAHPSNEYFVVAFNQKPQVLLEPTADREAVLRVLEKMASTRRRGATALYDTLYLAVDKVRYGRHPKRALLLVTDGTDTISEYSFNQVRRALSESDATLYILNLDDEIDLDATDDYALGELARVTGGRVFRPFMTQKLKEALARIAEELRSQYTLGFVPPPAGRKDGWHDLKIKVPHARGPKNEKIELFARTRPGFYEAPPRRGQSR